MVSADNARVCLHALWHFKTKVKRKDRRGSDERIFRVFANAI